MSKFFQAYFTLFFCFVITFKHSALATYFGYEFHALEHGVLNRPLFVDNRVIYNEYFILRLVVELILL